jgi:hypothetical protein
MALLTKPASVIRGQDNEFSLTQADLIALMTSLSAPAHFLDTASWKVIKARYVSPNGQKRSVRFNIGEEISGVFQPSLSANSIFTVRTLEVCDFDGGKFTIPRSELPVAEFDIEMDALPASNHKLYAHIYYDAAGINSSLNINSQIKLMTNNGEEIININNSISSPASSAKLESIFANQLTDPKLTALVKNTTYEGQAVYLVSILYSEDGFMTAHPYFASVEITGGTSTVLHSEVNDIDYHS